MYIHLLSYEPVNFNLQQDKKKSNLFKEFKRFVKAKMDELLMRYSINP